MRTFVSKRRLRSASLKDAASKGEQVLRLSLFKKGTVAAALIGSICLIDSIQAQMPGRGPAAPVRPTVVAGIAGESNPVTRKKYVGNVEAIEEVDSVARVSGVLTVAPGFEEGSNVTKGQLLFTIDPVPYQARVEVAKATIQQLEAQIDYAEKNYNRLNELLKETLVR
jgi:multidrug efflux pump subunit AcrA (membrane-fusion protein)